MRGSCCGACAGLWCWSSLSSASPRRLSPSSPCLFSPPGQLRRPCSYSNSLSRSVAFPFQEGANQTNQPNALQGCARTEEEAAELRESSELLLVSASAQVLAATATLLVPVLPLALVAFMVGSYTAGRAADLVWMLLAYHRRVHGVAAFNYLVFYALRC
ncbi:hypothetical protein HU200_014018 [Digitaria exilis]|uniref:Transmembrane protein n=1 Tax=Digitaria exilis TaxID=1010633 RepID=A0A835KKI6_9POAL|nr:hypothetical protein HU200_014018 [Digitaria exilis]